MNRPRTGRPGAVSLALLLILVITAAWWALALWPAGAVEPAWLARTRAACFGSAPGGLPDAGGWILLIGQPIGMLGFLLSVWGHTLREELSWMRADTRWRWVVAGVGGAMLLGLAGVGQRVAHAAGVGTARFEATPGTPSAVDIDALPFVLTDQAGRRISPAGFPGRPVLLTFAFGHCTTVCPTIVHDLRAARTAANRPEIPILVISLDPWRDTPERLASLAANWELAGEDRVLSGSVEEVSAVLTALAIARQRDATTGDIAHVGTVMLLNERGRIVWRLEGWWGGVTKLLTAMPPASRPVTAGAW